MKYLDAALAELPRKYRLTVELDKVEVRMFVQSQDKLDKSTSTTVLAYQKLHSGESLIKVHKIPSIGAPGETRPEEEVK